MGLSHVSTISVLLVLSDSLVAEKSFEALP